MFLLVCRDEISGRLTLLLELVLISRMLVQVILVLIVKPIYIIQYLTYLFEVFFPLFMKLLWLTDDLLVLCWYKYSVQVLRRC